MAYNLGPVKPHVAAAVNYYAPKHGITTVYGYVAAGSVPSSDHPKGLAADYMTRDRAQGDALAADIIATGGSAYNVSYVIWWRRIHSLDDRGWRPYIGPRPHTDHVHVSHNPQPGTGVIPAGLVIPLPLPLLPLPGLDTLFSLYSIFTSASAAFQWITKPENWRRIGIFLVGAILFLLAFYKWNTLVKGSAKAIKGVTGSAKP
jgi:hypothetical protein